VAAVAFASANVSGLFFVSMDVVDHNGVHLPQITRNTQDARHVIVVENYSGLTQNAKVCASLPHGMRRIEFVPVKTATDSWSYAINGIPDSQKVRFECRLRRNNGSSDPVEPIRCDDVQDALGSLAFRPGSSGVPFFMHIAAQ
jgi:hypothetical protein